jgi:hypothetical protein
MRIDPMTSFATELAVGTPPGSCQLFATATYDKSAALMSELFDLANATLQPIKDVLGLLYSVSFRPVPTLITGFAAEDGGNALGLSPADGNLVLGLFFGLEGFQLFHLFIAAYFDRCNLIMGFFESNTSSCSSVS